MTEKQSVALPAGARERVAAVPPLDQPRAWLRWLAFSEGDKIAWLSRAPDAEAEALWSVAMREGG